ncbi:MAG: hypothetical protein CVT77_09940 [Alphaproteobacteria bacterium HGW-Alphaproteobacteria-16]|nr:MAG: hypothetical protein CVT77_09940 [Alphaproteobacteria bacterium HGW-Alphaproteobacteria-16]
MKLIALASALVMVGTAAVAQDMTAPAPAEPTTTAEATPMGGYQPTAPAMSGQPQPGQQVIFQPSKSPTEAFPPPPAMEEYPICKKGQYDKCRQRGG